MLPEDMARLHKAAFPQSRPWSADEFQSVLETNGAFAVAKENAFALVRVIVDEAELLTIATHPDHRRKGLAARVMADWQAEARKRGAVQAFLEVAEDNSGAIRLYRQCGFGISGRRRDYYPRPGNKAADALLMTRQL